MVITLQAIHHPEQVIMRVWCEPWGRQTEPLGGGLGALMHSFVLCVPVPDGGLQTLELSVCSGWRPSSDLRPRHGCVY